MANRVLIDANNFKVSKTGVDVLTANNSQLLIRNDATSLGSLQTGTVTPAILDFYTAYNVSRNFLLEYEPQTHPLVNPTDFVPLMHLQRIDDSNSNVAWGGGYYHEYNVAGIWVDQSGGFDTIQPGPDAPDAEGYWILYITRDTVTSVFGGGAEVINGVDDFQLRAYKDSTYRYNAFFTKTTDDDLAPDIKDRTPNAIDFIDKINLTDTVATNDQTITGIDAGFFIEAQFDSSLSSANGERVIATRESAGVAPTSFEATSGNSLLLNVIPDCTLNFLFEGTGSKVLNITLVNLNDSNAVLDTFRLGVNTTNVAPSPVDWANLSGTGYDENANQTITNINTGITLRAELSSTLQAGDYLAVFTNGSIVTYESTNSVTFNVNNDDTVRFAIYSANGYSGTVTIKNVSDGNLVLDTFTASISANNSIPDTFPEWTNLSASTTSSFATDTTNTQVVSGFSGSTTLYVDFNTIFTVVGGGIFPSYTFTIRVFSNGSQIASFDDSDVNNTFTVPNNASVYFVADLDASGGNIQITGFVEIGTVVGGQNAFLDSIPVNMYAEGTGGGL